MDIKEKEIECQPLKEDLPTDGDFKTLLKVRDGRVFLVGYADEVFIYLLPETARAQGDYLEVNEAIRAQGDYLAALAREELIEVGKDGKHTRFKWIQGGSKRVIYLPRRVLGHDEVMEDEQV